MGDMQASGLPEDDAESGSRSGTGAALLPGSLSLTGAPEYGHVSASDEKEIAESGSHPYLAIDSSGEHGDAGIAVQDNSYLMSTAGLNDAGDGGGSGSSGSGGAGSRGIGGSSTSISDGATAPVSNSSYNELPGPRRMGHTAVETPSFLRRTASDIPLDDTPSKLSATSAPSVPSVTHTSAVFAGTEGGPNNFTGLYSSTGFDLLAVLMRVVTRKNPKINLGPVDMSCSFVVTTARDPTFPIVYASPNFERLTGYSMSEVVGRNCRFLQAPDGNVEPGSQRMYTDQSAVSFLKHQQVMCDEAQVSLINYRKSGQPFINLLTIIPVSTDGSDGCTFFVGFQIDLVEQPESIMKRMRDGTYSVNYQLTSMPLELEPPPLHASKKIRSGDGAIDLRSSSASVANAGAIAVARGKEYEAVLQNMDDLVYILSLKGVILYASPSCRHVLEYEPDEITGLGLSSICHPSDVVSVMRVVRDASNSDDTVSFVFRVHRKRSGYTWLESVGRLNVEPVRGRKCIVMAGRYWNMPSLTWRSALQNSQIQENEFWAKISHNGILLCVSSTCSRFLDYENKELYGLNLKEITRGDGEERIEKALQRARKRHRVNVRHLINCKSGRNVEVLTTLLPDAPRSPLREISGTFIMRCREMNALVERELTLGQSGTASGIGTREDAAGSSGASPAQTPDGLVTNAASDWASVDLPFVKPSLPSSMSIAARDIDERIYMELDPTRSTSWQYEFQHLRLANRRLQQEINDIMATSVRHQQARAMRQSSSSKRQWHNRTGSGGGTGEPAIPAD